MDVNAVDGCGTCCLPKKNNKRRKREKKCDY